MYVLLFWWHNTLIEEKSQESILIYSISYKTLIDSESLCIKFY